MVPPASRRVGIVGLGSVGSIIVEALSRVGISDITLVDHDRLEQRNLDRTLHSTSHDAETGTHKVCIAAAAQRRRVPPDPRRRRRDPGQS